MNGFSIKLSFVQQYNKHKVLFWEDSMDQKIKHFFC